MNRMRLDTKSPDLFFGTIAKSPAQSTAMEEVAREKVQATVIDASGLEFYKEVKGPFFNQHLKVLQQSETFLFASVA